MPIPMSTQFDQKDPRYGKGPSQRTPLLNRREVSDIPVASWSTRCSGIFEMLARLKGYSLLEDKERLATSASHSTHHSITFQVSSVKWPRLLSILIVLLALSLTGGVGFFVGKKSTGDVKNPLDVERTVFQYLKHVETLTQAVKFLEEFLESVTHSNTIALSPKRHLK